MKKIVLIALTLIGASTLACSKKNKMYNGTTISKCLKAEIARFSQSPLSCETGASLKQYTFQNKTVYVFEPGNCGADMASAVVDEHCNNIGNLGGFAGNMKINGEDFSSATYVRTIWSN